jgi:hypothetical protein
MTEAEWHDCIPTARSIILLDANISQRVNEVMLTGTESSTSVDASTSVRTCITSLGSMNFPERSITEFAGDPRINTWATDRPA